MRNEGISKLTSVKRKANVGELIRIEAAEGFGHYENGDIAEVVRICETYPETLIYVNKWGIPVHIDEYVVLEEIDPANERLTSAEAKITALEAEVAALKQAQEPEIPKRPFMTGVSAEVIGKALEALAKAGSLSAQTPNQRRAGVIKRAQAFVADLERRAESPVYGEGSDGNDTFSRLRTDLTFHVNSEKGVVTALAHGRYPHKVVAKAFAKCHPNDVFNADIGKAIAAGKLYGVDIPQEFVDAPKPTEVVVGMRVKANYYTDTPPKTFVIRKVTEEIRMHPTSDAAYFRYEPEVGDRIIEDTDADYS